MTYDYWSPALNYFASRGMLAISFEYRLASRKLSQRSAKNPVLDTRSAIRWVRKHAGLLHANPDKIVTAGNSAGGYLALVTAAMDGVNKETGADLRIADGK